MSWKSKRVLLVAILFVAVSSGYLVGSENKEDDQKRIAAIDYDQNGQLLIATGANIMRAGSRDVVYTHFDGSKIIDFACSKNDPEIFSVIASGRVREVNMSTQSLERDDYDDPKIVSVQYASDGILIGLRRSNEPSRFTAGELHNGSWRPYQKGERCFVKAGEMDSKKFYPITIEDKRFGCMSAGNLLLCPPTSERAELLWDDADYDLKDFCYANGRVAMLCTKRANSNTEIKLYHLDLKSKQLYDQDEVDVSRNNYDRLELIGGGGLVATHQESGADFYSIMSGYGVFSDGLKKKRSISTNGQITHIASTPAGWFSCGRTALATEASVKEIDSGTGENIATYGPDGERSHNWWRTVRRNVVTPALVATSVAATVLAYNHFQGKR